MRLSRLCLLLVVAALASAAAPESFFLTFHTTVPYSDGKIVLHLNRSLAPLGVDRLWELVQANYYARNSFFRVLPGFVVQFGIAGDPSVSRYWDQMPILDDPVATSNLAGTLAYATAGNDTRTTQLFINYANNTQLDARGFSPLGRVVRGMDVAEHIFSGYAQQPSQDEIYAKGNSYLESNYPKLDYIIKTTYAFSLEAATAHDPDASQSVALLACFAVATLILIAVSVRAYTPTLLSASATPQDAQEIPLTQLNPDEPPSTASEEAAQSEMA